MGNGFTVTTISAENQYVEFCNTSATLLKEKEYSSIIMPSVLTILMILALAREGVATETRVDHDSLTSLHRNEMSISEIENRGEDFYISGKGIDLDDIKLEAPTYDIKRVI